MKEDTSKINARQLALFYFIYSVSVKLISLPSALAAGAGGLAWVSAAVGGVFEVLAVLIAAMFIGKTIPRAFYILFLPLLIVQLWLTAKESAGLNFGSLFSELPIFVFAGVLILVAVFFAARPTRAVFRANEILWGLGLIALIAAVVPTLYGMSGDLSVLTRGDIGAVLPAFWSNAFYFEGAVFVLIFGGEVKPAEKPRRKLVLTAVLCAVGFVLFTALFTLLFGGLAAGKGSAIVDMTTASKYITNTGAFDWFIASGVLTMLLLRFGAAACAIWFAVKKAVGNVKKRA